MNGTSTVRLSWQWLAMTVAGAFLAAVAARLAERAMDRAGI